MIKKELVKSKLNKLVYFILLVAKLIRSARLFPG